MKDLRKVPLHMSKTTLTGSLEKVRGSFLSDICSFGLDFKPQGKQD